MIAVYCSTVIIRTETLKREYNQKTSYNTVLIVISRTIVSVCMQWKNKQISDPINHNNLQIDEILKYNLQGTEGAEPSPPHHLCAPLLLTSIL